MLQNVGKMQKEQLLRRHSEKIALCYALISTEPGTPVYMTQNLRMCGDCHNATALISKIVNREITVRDARRFHHFKDGVCSCNNIY